MNIQHFWNQVNPDQYPTMGTINEMLRLRKEKYDGFIEVEQSNGGFLEKQASLSTPRGQEMFRLLLFRTVEEIAESMLATDPAHRKEEMIDALNYFLSALMLDPEVIPELDTALFGSMTSCWVKPDWTLEDEVLILDGFDCKSIIRYAFGNLPDFFRNRTWMNNQQEMYFAGHKQLHEVMDLFFALIFQSFVSFQEFHHFYLAKDEVLRFRLQTAY